MRIGEVIRKHVRAEAVGVLIAGTVIVGSIALGSNRSRPELTNSSKSVTPLGTNIRTDRANCVVFQVVSSRPGSRTRAFLCAP